MAHTYQQTNGGRRTTFTPGCVLIRAIQRTRPFPTPPLLSSSSFKSLEGTNPRQNFPSFSFLFLHHAQVLTLRFISVSVCIKRLLCILTAALLLCFLN